MILKIKVLEPFFDKYELGKKYEVGDILETKEKDRAIYIGKNKLGKLVGIDDDNKKHQVVVYTSRIFNIGGIETACWNIAKEFENEDILFVFGEADIEKSVKIAEHRPVRIDDGRDIECDVLIVMGYDGLKRIRAKKIKARKIYHQIHADWSVLRNKGLYKGYTVETKGVDKFLAVSDTAKKGFKTAFGLDSVVVPNILAEGQERGIFRIFCVLTRFEQEKGIDILIEMIKRFESARNGQYKERMLWVICGDGSLRGKLLQLKYDRPYIVLLPPCMANQDFLQHADYLVQTSYCESYCYSIHQALNMGVPVISTAIPEAKKVIEEGKTGYLVSMDLHDLDVDKIMEKCPSFEAKWEKVEPIWEKVLKGEL